MREFPGDNEAIVSDEGFTGCADTALAVGSEGDVGGGRVPAVERPFGLAVADDEDAGCGGHFVLGGRVSEGCWRGGSEWKFRVVMIAVRRRFIGELYS